MSMQGRLVFGARPLQWIGLTACFLITACRGSEVGMGGPPDSGAPVYADAHVVVSFDAGVDKPALPNPTLTAVAPNSGSVNGGTRVTLRGASFGDPIQVFF